MDVSPPKWHLGHTTWFFETFVLSNSKKYKLFDEDYSYLFNSYYESVGKRVLRVNRGLITRPSVEEVMHYRSYVDEQIENYLASDEFPEGLVEVMELGLQHEQQHQELLLYDIKYILGHNPLFPAYLEGDLALSAESKPLGYLTIGEDVYDIGFQGSGFHFDNELGRHKRFLHAFEIGDRLITNAEYFEFIQDGGYVDFRHWLSEGWDWVNKNTIRAPHYWHEIEGVWHYYTLFGLKEINWHEPVAHISYFEADAYARWRGERLPTEFEWEVAVQEHQMVPASDSNFVQSELYHPAAADGSSQFFGDLWEWTASSYTPYPYFKTVEGAIGEYNGKFMVNQMVLRGGSFGTSLDHIRPTYRNFFHPHLRWLFNGLRLAKHI